MCALPQVSVCCISWKVLLLFFDYNNPYMLGFPIVAQEGYIEKLLNNGYTVITIIQEGNSKTGEITLKKVLITGANSYIGTSFENYAMKYYSSEKYLSLIHGKGELAIMSSNSNILLIKMINELGKDRRRKW